ncbi:hypothetical protein [Entomospira culicis]|uniref:PpiC domain-containing protein n=1 Tax=Entomospira culicis TaxID=2719989 RepID=A0A968GJK5_9SPIO|nr:hypothetical protein [Entomospira culicis]NIZ19919.1 hypothetical protein [Entomospira culicis]NIZ70124.1 hypothetical protein [Entomospira culicis]WDI38051.1 hypothetical protein PVA46_07885 [Entomospira culicis]WDI39674.1 hypothetical protein PVA47_07885 [Entomospira culicis]
MKRLLIISSVLLTGSLVLAQSNLMQSVLKEQSKSMVQSVLSGHSSQDKRVTKWVKSLDKEFKDVRAMQVNHQGLVELNAQAKELNVELSELLIDIEIYQALGLKNAQGATLQALRVINTEAIKEQVEEHRDDYLARRTQLRPQVAGELSLLDIHLFTLMEMEKIDKKNRAQYVGLTYGTALSKDLTKVVAKIQDYSKRRAKVDMKAIARNVEAAQKPYFSNERIFQETIHNVFGDIPQLVGLQATQPLGMVVLLLALDVEYPNNPQQMESALNQIYAHPQVVEALMQQKSKSIQGMQALHNQLQGNK